MKASRTALAIVAALSALSPSIATSRWLPIKVEIRDAGACYASVEGNSFKLPDDAPRFKQRLKQLRKTWREASIVGGTDVPYRCVGGVIYIAQSAHFRKVGFVGEPPR